MPFIPAAFATIGSAVVTTVASAAILIPGVTVATALAVGEVALSVLSTVAISALSSGITALTSPKVGRGGSPVTFKADPDAGIPYAMGRCALGGFIVGALTSFGDKNKHLGYFAVLTLGPVDSLESFSANATPVSFNGAGAVTAGTYAGKMWRLTQLGAESDPALPIPSGAGSFPEWTADHKMTGYAAFDWVLKYDPDVYPNGTPKPLTVGQWVKVYDPRLDSTYDGGAGAHRADDETTWTYSRTPALHALAFCLGRRKGADDTVVIGLGADPSQIDLDSFVEAANVQEDNGWHCDGMVTSKDDKWAVLQAIGQAGVMDVTRLGGRLSCIVSTPRVSIGTIPQSDIVGVVSIPGGQRRRDKVNGIIGRYMSEDHGWQMVAADKVEIASYVAADGRARTRQLDFPLITGVTHLAQAASYAMMHNREIGPIAVPLKPQWRKLKPGDVVTAAWPDYGLETDLQVLKRSHDPRTGAPVITFRTETAAKHTAALAATGAAPPVPELTGIDPTPPAPAAGQWSAVGTALTSGDGVSVPAVVVTGSPSDFPTADEVIVEIKPSDGANYALAAAGPSQIFRRAEIFTVTSATDYDLQVRYRRGRSVGPATSLGTVTTGGFAGSGATADITPDAIAWADITATGSSPVSATTSLETFTGIDAAITVQVTWTGAGTGEYTSDGSTWTALSSGDTIARSAGDQLGFRMTRSGSAGTSNGTVTVKNLTESPDTTLDTFAYSCTVSGSDVTPDAINWGNLVGTGTRTGTAQTFAGISTTITLRLDITGAVLDVPGLYYRINSGSWVSFTDGTLAPPSVTLTVSNGDALQFKGENAEAPSDVASGMVSIVNESDGDAVLDTFSFALY